MIDRTLFGFQGDFMGSEMKFYINNISEHDIDVAISHLFILDKDFAKLFVDADCEVNSVEISKADSSLGESDITVVVNSNSKKIGILIEDKIDAVAMPRQPERYEERGKKGIENGEFLE